MVNEHKEPESTLEHPEDGAEFAKEVAENQDQQSQKSTVEPTAESNEQPSTDEAAQSTSDTTEDKASDEQELMIAALQQEIAALVEKLNGEKEQCDAYKSQYTRIAADFDNFRRRTQKEKEELEQQAKRNTILQLLPVVDNFERARTQIKPNNDGEMAIHKSYQGVYKDLVDSLKRLGVAAMKPEGKPFDPNYHEAMLREPTTEYPEDTVIEQLVRGYLLNDLVLRHAMVKVAVYQEPVITSESDNAESSQTTDSAQS